MIAVATLVSFLVLPARLYQQSGASDATRVARTTLAPLLGEKTAASALSITSPFAPESRVELVTCEAILVGERDLGVFQVKPDKDAWRESDGAWSYAWKLDTGLELAFRAKPEADSVLLVYELKNTSKAALERVQVHPCLPTLGAPEFFPGTEEQAKIGPAGRAARIGTKDYSELWKRLTLWHADKPFVFESSVLAKTQKHLGYLSEGAAPIQWSWWVNANERFDLPLIAATSKDKKQTLALGFESAQWASSNANDPRACFHLFPWFGTLAAGETKAVRGRLYWSQGDAEAVRARFVREFPAAGRK